MMKNNAVFIITLCVALGFISSGHTETLYIENKKGSDTMILRTKPSNTTPRPRREYTDEQILEIAPPTIHYESTGKPYFPEQRPPHHSKPPHHGHRPNRPHKPTAPNAPSRPYKPVTPQE